jgi:transposase
MANKQINMSKLRQILKLHFQGLGTKKIAQNTSVSRNTIKRYLQQVRLMRLEENTLLTINDQQLDELFRSEIPLPSDATQRMQTLFSFFDREERRLKKKGVTLYLLWQDYIKENADGYQQTSYYHYYSIWKKKFIPSMHMEHKAGDKMFIDFAGEKLKMIDQQTGEIVSVEVFVAILGASQLTYVEAVPSQKLEDFISACENALYYFGGAPSAIVPDNLKAAVIKSHRYEPKLNENFEAFADHYGMAVNPARAYKPKDKALVEGAVKISYRRIYALLGEELPTSLEQLNQKMKEHLETHNNKLFQGRTYSRRQQFEEMEKANLQPLTERRFEMFSSAHVTVMKNSHVSLTRDKHYYSVPHAYIGKKVKLLYSKSIIQIYYKYEIIAEHQRIKSPHNYTTVAQHMPQAYQNQMDWNPEKFLGQAREIHPDVEDYIQQVLLKKPHPEQAYKSCQGILSFAKRVGNQRLIKACQRAREVGWYNYKTIENILQKGLDRQSHEDSAIEMPKHENIRGKDYYQ